MGSCPRSCKCFPLREQWCNYGLCVSYAFPYIPCIWTCHELRSVLSYKMICVWIFLMESCFTSLLPNRALCATCRIAWQSLPLNCVWCSSLTGSLRGLCQHHQTAPQGWCRHQLQVSIQFPYPQSIVPKIVSGSHVIRPRPAFVTCGKEKRGEPGVFSHVSMT